MPERQEVQSPFGQREMQYQGPRVSGSLPNPSQYQADDGGVAELVNSISTIAGVGASVYIDKANKKANADRVIQTGRAVQGLSPTNDATNAGYKAHTAIKLQGKLAKSKADLKQLAEMNPTDEEWETAIREHYTQIDNDTVGDYLKYGVDDAEVIKDLNKLTSLGMSEMMPEVTSYRELKKVEAEEQARKDTALDVIVNEFQANPGLPTDQIAVSAERRLSALRLTPADQDAVMANAVLVSKDPRMIEASKQFYNGRKTSLYERTAALQKMDGDIKASMASNNAVEMGTFKFGLEEKLYNGEINEEAFKLQADAGNTKYGGKLYTDDQVKGVLEKAKTENEKRIRAQAIHTALVNGVSMHPDVKNSEKTTALVTEYDLRNTEMIAEAVRLPKDQQAQFIKTKTSETNRYIAAKSVEHNVPFDKFVGDFKSFANMNVASYEEGTPIYEQMRLSLGRKAEEMDTLLDSFDGATKEFYLGSLPQKEAKVIRLYDMFRKGGYDDVFALKNAQKEARTPKVQTAQKDVVATSRTISDKVFDNWYTNENKAMQDHASEEMQNMLNLFPDPTSEHAINYVTEYAKTAYTPIDNGVYVKGTANYWKETVGINPEHLSSTFEAAIQEQSGFITPQLVSGDIEDVIPVVNTDTGMVSFKDLDGNIVGQTLPVKQLPKILSDYQKKEEAKAWNVLKTIRSKTMGWGDFIQKFIPSVKNPFDQEVEVPKDEKGNDVDVKPLAKVVSGKLDVKLTKTAAESKFIESIKTWENPDDKGLVGEGKNAIYTKFKSAEGNAGNPDHTEFEIGAGIKVLTKWKSRDPKDWPKISGVPVDVWGKGLTKTQLKEFTAQIANDSISKVKSIPGYDSMSEAGKMYWADLIYNAGAGAPAKNPKAMEAMSKGHVVEGIVKTFDFVNTTIDGKKVGMRGLLKRRLARYNSVAESESGVPSITEYKWSKEGVMVKFAYPKFMTDKVSDKFNSQIDEDGWMKINIKNVSASLDSDNKIYKDV